MTNVDRLGAVKAQIAELRKTEHELDAKVRRDILYGGSSWIEGALFRATLSIAERVTLNVEKVRTLLPEAEFPQAYNSKLVETLRVVSRTGEHTIAEAA